jgi:LAO/AO transport system kinase
MDGREILQRIRSGDPRSIGRAITLVENLEEGAAGILEGLDRERIDAALVLGVTGPPGAGKSTLTGRIVRLLRDRGQRVGIIAVDPSSPLTGGALLGDRIRMMHHALDPQVVVRSMATRGKLGGLCAAAGAAVRIMAASGCNTVIIETVGIGQSEMDIIRLADISILVLAPGFGDEIQAMKAGILEVADLVVVNKSDRPGADKLAFELGSVFAGESEKDLRLLQASAEKDTGVDELVRRLHLLEERYRRDNTFSRRRRRSATLETVDWALELLRPRLAALANRQDEGTDPRLAAGNIIRQLEQDIRR